MKTTFSEMGKLSAAARRSPEHDRLKAEAIRMHVELDYGINAIAPRIGINKTSIRRWLIAAGCYRVGHRTTRVKNDGAKLIDCSPTDLGRKQIFAHIWQRRAWEVEWEGVARWDELSHWAGHPAKHNFYLCRTSKEKRRPFLKPKKIANRALAAQKIAWASEWVGVKRWDEKNLWIRHPMADSEHRRIYMAKSRKSNPALKIIDNMRKRIANAIKSRGLIKSRRTQKSVGCSAFLLVEHLKGLLRAGMTLDNYGTYWEVDHKIPCVAFDLSKEDQQLKCFHWSNLMPLTAKDNREKSDGGWRISKNKNWRPPMAKTAAEIADEQTHEQNPKSL